MANWKLREKAPHCLLPDSPMVFSTILWNRGVRSAEEARNFLAAPLGNLEHPDRWPGIAEAAEFLAGELAAGKKLAVWGDYDVDGVTSTALVLDVLEGHGITPLWHIPSRSGEGYGLNVPGIEHLHEQGADIVLTVDSGIADVRPITRARELGISVIVTDHHLPPAGGLPPANFLVNPHLCEDKAPYAFLAGVGVTFFFMAAVNLRLAKATGVHFRMDRVLDLVALGTVADVMPLTGQNRILVHGGLPRIRDAARPGLKALLKSARIVTELPLSAQDVGFRLAPRINAAGRLDHASTALEMLRAKDSALACQKAQFLESLNTQRKDWDTQMYAQAREEAAKHPGSGLVLFHPEWHPGVLGIVASRITETYNVPTVLLCQQDNFLKGSGRSIPGLDLHAALSECSDTLAGFGGHAEAAGVRLLSEKLPAFRAAFDRACAARLEQARGEHPQFLDAELGFDSASDMDFLRQLEMLEPLGQNNPEPVFQSLPCRVVSLRVFKNPDSGSLFLEDGSSRLWIKVWRRIAEFQKEEVLHSPILVAYTVRRNWFNDEMRTEATLVDWKFA